MWRDKLTLIEIETFAFCLVLLSILFYFLQSLDVLGFNLFVFCNLKKNQKISYKHFAIFHFKRNQRQYAITRNALLRAWPAKIELAIPDFFDFLGLPGDHRCYPRMKSIFVLDDDSLRSFHEASLFQNNKILSAVSVTFS